MITRIQTCYMMGDYKSSLYLFLYIGDPVNVEEAFVTVEGIGPPPHFWPTRESVSGGGGRLRHFPEPDVVGRTTRTHTQG